MLTRASSKHFLVTIAVVSAIVLGVSAFAGIFAYRVYAMQDDHAWVRVTSAITHVPAARLGSRWIAYSDYLAHVDALDRFLRGPVAREQGYPTIPNAAMKRQTLDRLLRISAVEELAASRGIVVTALDVQREYNTLIQRAGTSTSPEEIHAFLEEQFGWNETEFQRNIIRPAMLEDGLRQQKESQTKNANAFEQELTDRLAHSDVKRYLTF